MSNPQAPVGEANHLANGLFQNDLTNWDVSGAVYNAGDGTEHYGMAVLSTGGDYIEQDFSVFYPRVYTLHVEVRSVGGALTAGQATVRIVDGDGNTLATLNLSELSGNAWEENNFAVGLVPGTTYTLRITNVSGIGDLYVDDVWLWFVPVSRLDIAKEVHARLGRLASDRSYEFGPDGSNTEGSYTQAVDAALRAIGAIDPYRGKPDIRYLVDGQVNAIVATVVKTMLERLYFDYAAETDITLGPLRERRSQTAEKIGMAIGITQTGQVNEPGPVISRPIKHTGLDYEPHG